MRLTGMVSYRLDGLMLAAIAAAALDAWSMYYFLAHDWVSGSRLNTHHQFCGH
jgi:hypothetical protein